VTEQQENKNPNAKAHVKPKWDGDGWRRWLEDTQFKSDTNFRNYCNEGKL
jgi:hypothetical protein